MSNIISWECGYRLEPWNKCGFLGLQSSWATFSTQNRTLCLLTGEYKQSVGNFLWFLPMWFRNALYGGTQQHLWLWPPCRPSLKVTMVVAPKKPAHCCRPWSPARSQVLRGRGTGQSQERCRSYTSTEVDVHLLGGWRATHAPLRPHIHIGCFARLFSFVHHPASCAHLFVSYNFCSL